MDEKSIPDVPEPPPRDLRFKDGLVEADFFVFLGDFGDLDLLNFRGFPDFGDDFIVFYGEIDFSRKNKLMAE